MNHFLRAAALWLAVASSVALAADAAPAPAVTREASAPAAADAQAPPAMERAPETPATDAATPTPALTPLPASPATDDLSGDLTDDPFAAPDPNDSAEPESMLGTLWKMFLSLGIVIGLVYVTLNYGLRRLMGVRGAMLGRSSLVRVIERVPLDPKRSLFVIEAAGEYLLVGGADQNLTLISKLSPEEVKAHLAERQTAAVSKPSPFLMKLLARSTPPPAPPSPNDPPSRRTEDP